MIKVAHTKSKFMKENYIFPEERIKLAKLAGHLDRMGRHREADYVDAIIKKAFIIEAQAADLIQMFGGAFIDNMQGKIAEYLMEKVGIEPDGIGADFIKNLVENFDVDEVMAMMTMTPAERCEMVVLEVVNAMQKTLLERKVTNKLEAVLESTVSAIFGFVPGGLGADAVETIIDEAFIKSANELITTYLTDNNVISQYVGRILCDSFEALIGFVVTSFPAVGSMLGISPQQAQQMSQALDFSSLTGGLRSLQQGAQNIGGTLQQGARNVQNTVQQGVQHLQNQAQSAALQQGANQLLGPTLGPQAINIGQQLGIIP